MRYTDRVHFEAQKIGASCFKLEAPALWVPTPFPNNPIWKRIHEAFDAEHYLYPSPPLDLGRVHPDVEHLRTFRVLRCPVKLAGMHHLLVPDELAALTPLLLHALETERHINPNFVAFAAHLSFESTFVEAGTCQRVAGWHVDGFQGTRVPLHQVEHSYLWADTQGFEVCAQPFFLGHLDRSRHNVFDEIERQAHETNVVAALGGHTYLIDPYVVHRTPRVSRGGYRAFARLTFAPTELEDPVNTVNLSLLSAQGYEPRLDSRNRFCAYEGSVPWEYYGCAPRMSR